jgi:hypothetical protein
MNGGGLPPRGAAPSIAFTGGRYGKMLEIALVSPGNLNGILNRAFTMENAEPGSPGLGAWRWVFEPSA